MKKAAMGDMTFIEVAKRYPTAATTAALKMIFPQANTSTPEARLVFAVIAQAITDIGVDKLKAKKDEQDAVARVLDTQEWLLSETMRWYCELIDLDRDYVLDCCKKAGVMH